MKTNSAYSKAVIYEALNSLPSEQLEALKTFFCSLESVTTPDGFRSESDDTMSDQEYMECLSIAANDDWYGTDKIN